MSTPYTAITTTPMIMTTVIGVFLRKTVDKGVSMGIMVLQKYPWEVSDDG